MLQRYNSVSYLKGAESTSQHNSSSKPSHPLCRVNHSSSTASLLSRNSTHASRYINRSPSYFKIKSQPRVNPVQPAYPPPEQSEHP